MTPSSDGAISANDIATIFVAIISFATFLYVLIKDFLIPGKILIGINQIIFLRPPTNNRQLVAQAIIETDFKSSNQSDWVKHLITIKPELPRILQSGQKQLFFETVQGALTEHNIPTSFRNDLIIDLSKQTGFGTSFGIPVNLTNSGLKPIYISEIVLVFEDQNSDRIFYFDAFIVLKEESIYKPNPEIKDVDRIDTVFNGMWVPSKGVSSKLIQCILRIEKNDKIFTKTNILPGNYKYYVIGYSSDGEKIFESKKYDLKIEPITFINSFSGADISVKTN